MFRAKFRTRFFMLFNLLFKFGENVEHAFGTQMDNIKM